MREHLTMMRQTISTQARAAFSRVSPALERVRTASAGATATAMRHVTPALRWTGHQSKRAALGALMSVENVLLSAKGRERVHAASVFALIFGFAILSVDTILTGGPEFIPSAQASSMGTPRVDLIAATTNGGEVVQLAVADVLAPAVEPERSANLRPVRLAAAEAPAPTAAPDLLDATPAKDDPTPADNTEARVKAGADA
jgi:hypothetical protein